MLSTPASATIYPACFFPGLQWAEAPDRLPTSSTSLINRVHTLINKRDYPKASTSRYMHQYTLMQKLYKVAYLLDKDLSDDASEIFKEIDKFPFPSTKKTNTIFETFRSIIPVLELQNNRDLLETESEEKLEVLKSLKDQLSQLISVLRKIDSSPLPINILLKRAHGIENPENRNLALLEVGGKMLQQSAYLIYRRACENTLRLLK